MKPWIDVYIGLGSNLHNPLEQAEQAIDELAQHKHLRNVNASSLFTSKPVGPQDQPDYVNAAVYFQTQLGAHDLLDLLQSFEQEHGRVRNRHWGERTLDLDLLCYGNAQIHTPRLTVPHSFMLERSFVLYPLHQLAPNMLLSNGKILSTHLENIPFDLQLIENGN
ncbi:MAG: 2-amino-4-hydroxy-6-hydroxymethyldihydropteridine diphosphokinase [Bermanella sp.]|jgi:2-amino-4-hydroxy-6-hydroxymethyldihydropteridine diphosphokinase